MAKKEKNVEGRMTIWEHLGELRRRLTVIAVTLIIAVCVIYIFAPELILFLVNPVADVVLEMTGAESLNEALKVFEAMEPFVLRFKVAAVFSIFLTSPIWIWQIMAFFLPALKPNERRWVLPTFFAAVALFMGGMVFCYFFILNPAFDWLLSQLIGFSSLVASASNFVNYIILFELAFGLAFQLPLIIFYLIVFNVVPYKKLRKNWRVVYVALMTFSAMITPDVSPVPMLIMFVAMTGLYELSLLVARVVLNSRIKTLEARDSATSDEDEDDA